MPGDTVPKDDEKMSPREYVVVLSNSGARLDPVSSKTAKFRDKLNKKRETGELAQIGLVDTATPEKV